MEKKYRVIVKVGNKPNGDADTKRWNCTDLLSLVRFLDKDHPTWTWINVYSKSTRKQVANFTKNKRPTSKWV